MIDFRFIVSALIIISTLIALKLINFFYKKIFKENKAIHILFFKNLIRCVFIFICITSVAYQFDAFKDVSKTLLTGGSLLIVVLGFAIEKALENALSGILISIRKPFSIDDRITLGDITKDGVCITGKVEDITVEQTVVRTFNNERVIIPNSKINNSTIINSSILDERSGRQFEVVIDYKDIEKTLPKAKKILEEIVLNNQYTIDRRTVEEKEKNIPIVKELVSLQADGVKIQTTIWTNTLNDNFTAISEITEEVLFKFAKENIGIAYTHIEVSGKIN